MAFCEFCGKEIADGQKCDCQQAIANGQTAAPQADISSYYNEPSAEGNTKKKNKTIIAVIAAIAVAAVAVLCIVVMPNGYEKALNTYFDGVAKGKSSLMLDAVIDEEILEDYIESLIDAKMSSYYYWLSGEKLDYDSVMDSLDEEAEKLSEDLEDKYGKNVKITYTIEKKKDIKKKDMDAIEDAYDELDMDVVQGYDLTLKATVKGKKKDSSKKINARVVKLKKYGWKVCIDSGIADEIKSTFL